MPSPPTEMQCAPRPSIQILNPLIAYFYSLAEVETAGEIPTQQSAASQMNAADVDYNSAVETSPVALPFAMALRPRTLNRRWREYLQTKGGG